MPFLCDESGNIDYNALCAFVPDMCVDGELDFEMMCMNASAMDGLEIILGDVCEESGYEDCSVNPEAEGC